jgi:hypothetical protein
MSSTIFQAFLSSPIGEENLSRFPFHSITQATTPEGEPKPLRRLTGRFWLQVGYF